MFTILFLSACGVYVLLNVWLVRGLRALRAAQAATPDRPPAREGLPQHAPGTHEDDHPLVSVLVAARDEEHNLPHTLNALLAQEWPVAKTQIIVINDRSTDGTAAVLDDYAARYPGRIEVVTVTDLPPGLSPKKHALARGLDVARGTWVAVTDADCIMGPRWLSRLAALWGPGAPAEAAEAAEAAETAGTTVAAAARGTTDKPVGMVVGPTAYQAPRGDFTPSAGARALEFLSYGVCAAGLVGLGFPVIANANNIAYRREAFDAAGGFAGHSDLSGDDDFILQDIHATGRWSIRYCTHPESRVFTTPPETWAHFWEQRKRWAGKCVYYRAPQLAFLLFIFLFYATIAVLLIAGLFGVGDGHLGKLGLLGLGLKAGAELLVMREGLSLFNQFSLIRYFPFTALIHIPLILAATVCGVLGQSTWKGQKLRARRRGKASTPEHAPEHEPSGPTRTKPDA